MDNRNSEAMAKWRQRWAEMLQRSYAPWEWEQHDPDDGPGGGVKVCHHGKGNSVADKRCRCQLRRAG